MLTNKHFDFITSMQIVIQAAVITGAPLYHERSVMIRFCYLLIRHHLNSCCCCCFRLNSECCNTAKMPFLSQWVWWWGFLKNVHFKDFNCTITIREKKELKKKKETKKRLFWCFVLFFLKLISLRWYFLYTVITCASISNTLFSFREFLSFISKCAQLALFS